MFAQGFLEVFLFDILGKCLQFTLAHQVPGFRRARGLLQCKCPSMRRWARNPCGSSGCPASKCALILRNTERANVLYHSVTTAIGRKSGVDFCSSGLICWMWWGSSFRARLHSIMLSGTSVTMHPMQLRAHGAGIQRPAFCLQSCNCQCALSHIPPCLCQTRLAHFHANISCKHLFQHVGKFDGCGCYGTDRPVSKAIVRKNPPFSGLCIVSISIPTSAWFDF